MLASVEHGKQLHHARSSAPCKVAEMPELVLGLNNFVPEADQSFVVRRNCLEWSFVDPQHARIAEVRVAGEVKHVWQNGRMGVSVLRLSKVEYTVVSVVGRVAAKARRT